MLIVGGGGEGEGSVAVTSELYEPSSRSWIATGGMAEPRGFHTAMPLSDGKVLVAGGGGGGGPDYASAELYDPRTGSWTATASMDWIRLDHTATLLPDGTVLVAGGLGARSGSPGGDNYEVLASAELFGPSRP